MRRRKPPEREETIAEFLDHAALVADSDQLDEQAAVSLLTVHNAKGLEFQNVFLAGMEEGLFPHSRSLTTEGAMEEERRLCYVGMTRARKRLYLSWARYRRRFGGGQLEPCLRSRFVNEVPPSLTERLSAYREHKVDEVDVFSEQHDVRQSAKKNLYTGRTVNSVDNIAQFFAERGIPLPSGLTRPAPAAAQGASTASGPPIPNHRTGSQSPSSNPGATPMQPRPPVQSSFLTRAVSIHRLRLRQPVAGRAARKRAACASDLLITKNTGREGFFVAKAMAMMRN